MKQLLTHFWGPELFCSADSETVPLCCQQYLWNRKLYDWLLSCPHLFIVRAECQNIIQSSSACPNNIIKAHTHTHTRLTALFPGLPRWAGTRKGKPTWILLKHETVSGSGISWAMCKSAPRCMQITTPAPHHSVFYRPDALPAAQPTASKHWRQNIIKALNGISSTDSNLFSLKNHSLAFLELPVSSQGNRYCPFMLALWYRLLW